MKCIVLGILQARIVEWVAFPFSSIVEGWGQFGSFDKIRSKEGTPLLHLEALAPDLVVRASPLQNTSGVQGTLRPLLATVR